MAGTFSETWYRVAHVRAALRPTVSFRKQWYRGQEWLVLHDPYAGSYFRLSPAFYRFMARLGFDRTIEELWLDALKQDPENAPGQQEVISLLNELNLSSLLYFKDPADSAKLFERRWKKEKKQTRTKVMNFLFLKFALWNPEQFLERLLPLWRVVFSPAGALIWLVVVLLAVKVGVENAQAFSQDAGNILNPGNLLLLYLCTAFVKVFHELGHAGICKRLGGEVPTLGVMLILLAPLPFVDASSSWVFRSKWQRILVSSGGMIVELFIGALACFVWAYSPPGLVHGLAYNMMFTATISTLLFNANPLMRFDGYYILSDLIEVPNLTQKSKDQVYGVVQRYAFGVPDAKFPARSKSEGGWLITYGIASMIYRVFLLVGIVLFIADSYLALGILLAVVLGTMWLLSPPVKFMKYLFKSPQLMRTRKRAMFVVGLLLSALGAAIFLVPLPRSFTAPGVVEAKEISDVVSGSPGRIEKYLVEPGQSVEKGAALVQLKNPELHLEIKKAKAQLENVNVLERQALREGGVDSSPIQMRKESLAKLISQLEEQRKSLTVRARHSGQWVFPEANNILGQWKQRGDVFGQIIQDENYRFSSVVSQEDASDFFDSPNPYLEVKLKGETEFVLQISNHNLLPHYQDQLPSQALGWKGGGDIAISSADTTGTSAQEPFYLLQSSLVKPQGYRLYHGRTGYIRVVMEPQPLSMQIVRYIRQFMQKRYLL